jgi:tetratricopeptide (TPR) repeat protein
MDEAKSRIGSNSLLKDDSLDLVGAGLPAPPQRRPPELLKTCSRAARLKPCSFARRRTVFQQTAKRRAAPRAKARAIRSILVGFAGLALPFCLIDSTAIAQTLAQAPTPPTSAVAGQAPAGVVPAPPSPAQEGVEKLSPAEQKAYYQRRLAAHPEDADALEGLARAEAGLKDFRSAIAAYRSVLAARPGDRDAGIQMARLLGWNGEYANSIRAFRALLDQAPEDREALDGLAHVQVWSGKLAEAAATYGRLAAERSGDTSNLFAAARLEAETHQYPMARSRLTSLLAVEPGNVDARLLLAELELKQGQYQSSLRQFERVLERRPGNLDALLGAAQTRYYTGDLAKAAAEAGEVVSRQPRNFDALFLLASIERARGRRNQARALLSRAARVSPRNPEVAELREKFWSESSTALHLTVGYSRELGTPAPGVPATLIEEDLRALTFGSRLDFSGLPRSSSSLSFNALPTESPSGFFGGAAAPTDFLYRQTTRLFGGLTLRAGIGVQHFGPGALVNFPQGDGPQRSATTAPIGFAGGSYALNEHVSFDLNWSHLGITYTPLAARLGVVSRRLEAGANVAFDSGTSLHLTYFQEQLSSEAYKHLLSGAVPGSTPTANAIDREAGSGGTLTFNRRMLERERLALDLGWSALAFGYNGPRKKVYLGFFTPRFYQRELFTPRVYGQLSRRVGYDVTIGLGVQQVDSGQALKRALLLTPVLTFKLTPYLSAKAGYTHYDSAQSLGMVRGNGAQLGIDWKF